MENTIYPRDEGFLFEDKITIRGFDGHLTSAILLAKSLGRAKAVDPNDRENVLARGKITLEKTNNDGSTPGRTMVFKYEQGLTVLNKAFLTGRSR